MPTYRALLAIAGLDRIDAQALFCWVSGHNRAWLIAHADDQADPILASAFTALAARRRAGEPVAYLLGTREFYGRDFAVSPAVLIPRPETELLVELAIAHAPPNASLLDLGTGSGCIPITLKLERVDLMVTAVDISAAALDVARDNAAHWRADIRLRESDWFAALAGEVFDVIIANPPYIPHGDPHLVQGDLRFEPRGALTDEADGLAYIRHIIDGCAEHLAVGGWLLFEHGYDQGTASRALLNTADFVEVRSWCDLAGLERVTGGRLIG